jgi:4-hydroxybenzoate polyprenyltransferase
MSKLQASFDHCSEPDQVPLCVDLDGTLIKTDVLLESVLILLKTRPLLMLLLPFWLLKGRAYLKRRLAGHTIPDVQSLPYNREFVEYLTAEHRTGRPLVLVTATELKVAKQVQSYLGLFSEILASDGQRNLKGAEKLNVLVERFGVRGFDYAGNAAVDLEVWREAREAIVVTRSSSLVARAEKVSQLGQVFLVKGSRLASLARALRVHQWVKNALVFVPLIVSHHLANPRAVVNAVLAFLAFSLCASGVYVFNDLLDLGADRQHAKKKHRPFAAGDLPLAFGMAIIPILVSGGVAISLFLPPVFMMTLGIYLVINLCYSLFLKQIELIDVIVLAGLYTIRIFAGAAAIGVHTSSWLLSFSGFLFLSLALVKRFAELRNDGKQSYRLIGGRGYVGADSDHLVSMGTASGYISVLVLGLYVSSTDVTILYQRPGLLWLICPLLFYWISRVWLLAHRGMMNEDPVVFAVKDKVSYAVCALAGLLMLLAT